VPYNKILNPSMCPFHHIKIIYINLLSFSKRNQVKIPCWRKNGAADEIAIVKPATSASYFPFYRFCRKSFCNNIIKEPLPVLDILALHWCKYKKYSGELRRIQVLQHTFLLWPKSMRLEASITGCRRQDVHVKTDNLIQHEPVNLS